MSQWVLLKNQQNPQNKTKLREKLFYRKNEKTEYNMKVFVVCFGFCCIFFL